jgi:hypothetical protein
VLVGGVVDVQDGLVGRKGEAVRQREIVRHQVEGPVRGYAIHAIARLLFSRDGPGPPAGGPRHARRAGLDAIGRVGEVDGAVGPDHDVVGAVEPLALELLRHHRAGAVVGDARDAAAVVLRRQYASPAIQGQAVGRAPGVGRQLRALRQPAPARDALVRDVAEEEIGAAPHRPFGEPEPARDAIDGGVRAIRSCRPGSWTSTGDDASLNCSATGETARAG